MYKFLLATDGSDNAMRAAKHLLSVCQNYRDAEIYIIAVYNFRMVINTEATLPGIEYDRYAGAAKQTALDTVVKTAALFKEAGIAAREIIEEGEPGAVIVEAAKSMGINQIVMGVSGLGKVKELFMGSVNRRVVTLSPCPVTVVK